MNGIRRTLSLRKKKKKSESIDCSKPQQWLDDEAKIKEGCCSFQVKYLGNIEVYESRGMQVCEEAIKALRKSKKKPQKAILYVSGDALRVSDDVSQHLIVDQTIEKVSFCAPDRSHDKGFAYICRDGATRRWMCHAFLAVKDSGERLSHAVGCAFAICLEKKQKRERDALQLAGADDRTYTRVGSFRPASLVERLIDPQSAILVEPVVNSGDDTNRSVNGTSPKATTNASMTMSSTYGNTTASSLCATSPSLKSTGAIPRPRPSPSMLERQGSLRLFPKLQANSPFKRDLSLRLEQLPSNLQRLARVTNGDAIPEESVPDLAESVGSPSSLGSPDPAVHPPIQTTVEPSVAASVSAFPNTSLSSGSTAQPSAPLSLTNTAFTHSDAPHVSVHSTGQLKTPSPVPSFPDPFSAAPFNPVSIHHYQPPSDQSWPDIGEFSNLSISTSLAPAQGQTTVSAATLVSAPVSIPTSPFLGGPPIAAPMSNSFAPVMWPSNRPVTRFSMPQQLYTSVSPQISTSEPFTGFNFNPNACGFTAAPPNPISRTSWLPTSQATSTWTTPLPSLLPPEPDRFADPFDVAWAERAMSTVNVTATHKPGNPFLSDGNHATGSQCFDLNGDSSSVSAHALLS